MKQNLLKIKQGILLLSLLAVGFSSSFAQDKIERPEEIPGNSINKFVKESFDIYDSTFSISAKIDLLNVDLGEYEKSLSEVKSDAALAAEGVKSGEDNAKESTAEEIRKRNIILGKINASSKTIEKTILKLSQQTVKLSTESPKTLQKSIKEVPLNMKAGKTLKNVKNNSKVSIQVLNLSKTELITQTKRIKKLKTRIAKLKK